MSTHLVECPFCRGRIEVDAHGKVVGQWEAKKKAAGGDSLKDAFEKLKSDKERREKYTFESAQESIERKKRESDEKFRQELERIKRDKDVTPPERPFDFD